ncbi:hypothetical protein T492DRAFT_958190 [Pavlovales sp. CCMP2436]|nr:hypothetical protein T492DRAFT_958190 [Pavlovales sp. CCMP2436]
MPSTAGRVRMPHNNKMTTSSTLKSSAVWQNVIGHDPYAPKGGTGVAGPSAGPTEGVQTDGNAYDNMRGLMALAKMTGAGGEVDDEKGKWRGKGKLRGGWLEGHQVPLAADDKKKDSDSDSDSSSDSDDSLEAVRKLTARADAGAKRGREEEERRRKIKKSKHKKEKKEKRKSSSKKEKHHKREKSEKKHKRSDKD